MVKCVCVECKSGYKSCSEKVRFFIVLKDKKIIKSWQISILRDDRKLKPGNAICEKHFKPKDILQARTPYAPDGVTVMGRVSDEIYCLLLLLVYSEI